MTPLVARLRALRPMMTAGVFIGLIAVLHTARVAYFAIQHSFFFGWGDDIGGFWLAKNLPFFKYLFSPIDVHRVPLLRLLSYFIFKLAPLRFEPAEVVLVAFHVAGSVCLFGALQQIRRTPANYALVAWCSINPYLGSQLFWWTAGAARLPYILFSNLAAYGYLRYRSTGSRRASALVVVCAVLSLGFFAKGVLIPGYLAALEFALRFTDPKQQGDASVPNRRPHVWLLLALLSALSVAYILAWRAATPAELREASLDPGFLFRYVGWTWSIFGLGTAGFLVSDGQRIAACVGSAWVLLIGYSVVRSRAALVAWAAVAAVISVSIYAGTSSARAHAAGPFMAVVGDRYYYELAPILVLFVGAAFRSVHLGSSERALLRHPLSKWGAAAGTVVAFAVLATNCYRGTERLFESNYSDFNQAKVFFDNVRDGLKRTTPDPDGSVPIVEGDIPGGLVLFVKQPRTNAQLLWLMGIHVKGATPRPGAYWITRQGHVYRL